ETQPQGWCCGSVFKNPPDNHAGRLIESCGLKGTRQGGAVISEKHANFIMNEDNASFEDVLGLIQLVKDTVYTRFGIRLEEEVRIIRP
ncbi:MAG TPA: UDP-N-acetylenolpyruvoylglucosamine reductase, partial [Candidatus Hydrogenedentes bacterium]|nr:UDP-N-acetylenolpyruvoylglucosamine reductase [Candidatus Hydrogenedentota bacterium]